VEIDRTQHHSSKLLVEEDLCQMYGAYVRGARSALGLSQSALAEMLGVNRTTLLRLEKGLPPLRKALCQATVEILKKAGVNSLAMDTLMTTPGCPKVLDIGIDMVILVNSFFDLPKTSTVDAKTEALFGQNYVAPLRKMPLRKNKTVLNTHDAHQTFSPKALAR